MTSILRAGLYCRVSTRDRQDPGNQEAQLRAFAEAQGWPVAAVYVDQESGAKGDRPQFAAMMAAASRREFDVLLFWSLDRLTREGALRTLEYLNQLAAWRVHYRSLTEPYLDSCGVFSDAIIALLGTLAKQERIRLSERVKAGLARAKANGTRTGKAIGRPRAVFRRDQVASMRAEGRSWGEIAERLGQSASTIRRAWASKNISGRD